MLRLRYFWDSRNLAGNSAVSGRPIIVMALAILVSLFLATNATASLTASYETVNSWNSGFQGQFIIENASSTSVSNWGLDFDLPANIRDLWGAEIAARNDDRYTLVAATWNTMIPANGSITVGFVAESTGGAVGPGNCQLNGAPCESGAESPSPPPPPPPPAPERVPAPGPVPSDVYAGNGPSIDPVYNYGDALQKAWYFYEAQRSGQLPAFDGDLPFYDPASGAKLHDGFLANRIPWRGASFLDDGADVGLDLTGGWHDAGDHVKFGLPMAFAASFLGWSVLEFADALRDIDQLDRARDNLRWVADYFVRAHPEPNVLYGQVGEGAIDHAIWGAPELMTYHRRAFKIDLVNSGPDLAAQTSAALAIISLVFRGEEPHYAGVLLQHARELYDFAHVTRASETPMDKSLGRYSDSIPDARSFYASTSGAQDDLPWAAAWLYRATKEARYLHDAEADYTRVAGNTGHTAWTAVWDDVRYALYVLMAQIAADPDYAGDTLLTSADRVDGFFDYDLHAKNFLNHWLYQVPRTPGGMAWLASWASARYNTMTGFLALLHRKHLNRQGTDPVAQQSYLNFATEQVNYVLGDNPLNLSYMVGFGGNASQVAHHRAAHSSTTNDVADPTLPRNVLYGGLAGGPRIDDTYTNDRNDFVLTEVANDINAGLNGVLAGLVDAHGVQGNQPDANFPTPPPAVEEIFPTAKLVNQQPASLGSQVAVTVVNETAYPPRPLDGLKFRYFVDLSEVFAQGFTEADLAVETYRNEGTGVSQVARWQNSASIFYVEGSFVGTELAPTGNQFKQKTIEFLIRLPWNSTGWNAGNDPSHTGLGASAVVKTKHIAVYDTNLPPAAQLVWGTEPDPATTAPPPEPVPTPEPEPDPVPNENGLLATVVTDSSWETGYCVSITVTNMGPATLSYDSLEFLLDQGVPVTQSWNGSIVRNSNSVNVALPTWVATIEPGETQKYFGFCATGNTMPTQASAS